MLSGCPAERFAVDRLTPPGGSALAGRFRDGAFAADWSLSFFAAAAACFAARRLSFFKRCSSRFFSRQRKVLSVVPAAMAQGHSCLPMPGRRLHFEAALRCSGCWREGVLALEVAHRGT